MPGKHRKAKKNARCYEHAHTRFVFLCLALFLSFLALLLDIYEKLPQIEEYWGWGAPKRLLSP